ncbi:unnamed protein product, partial [Polarella glacialis]
AGPGPVAPAAGSARGTAASPAPEGMASAAAAHGTSTEQEQEQQQLRQQQQQKQQQQQQQQQQEQEQRQRQQQEQQQEQQQQQEQEQEQRKPPQPPPKSSETPDAERCRGSAASSKLEQKVLSFQRFEADRVVVDPAAMEIINRSCRERGDTYVDPQFPPSLKSLYLSVEEEHTWECLSCRANSRMPPVPSLAKTREEAEEQEQDFKDSVRCAGCGLPPHYIVQVRYFTRPTQWLRPGHRCEGCELIYGDLPGNRDIASTMCTHFLRDSVSQVVLGTPWKVIREAARPEDVCQVVAQLPELIEKIFVTK